MELKSLMLLRVAAIKVLWGNPIQQILKAFQELADKRFLIDLIKASWCTLMRTAMQLETTRFLE